MNKILRYITLVGVFLIPFIPLIVINSFFFPYITGKNFAFRLIIEIIFGAWVVLAVNNPRYRPKATWIFWSLVAFMGAMFIADVFSIYPYKSFWSNFERMEGYITLLHLFVLFIVASTVLRAERLWNWFWNTSIGVSVIISVYGILQLIGKVPISQSQNRLDATLGNATYLAVYALFHIFIIAYILINDNLFLVAPLFDGNRNKKVKTIIGLILIVLETVVLYYTETRGAMLGLIGGVVLAAILVLIFERSRTLIRRVSMIVIALAVIVVLGFLVIRNTHFVRNSSTLTRFATISLTDPTTQSRFILWHMALKGFAESPKTVLVGWGQESFNYVFNKYYDPRLYSQEQWFDRTHNVIFDWLIAGGILGLGTYLWFYAALVWYIWRKTAMSVSEKSILTGLLAGYFIHNLFVFDNITSYILFFMVGAYIQTKATVYENAIAPITEVEGVPNRVILPVAIVVTAFVVYFVNYNAFMTNTTLISAITPRSAASQLGLSNAPYGGDVTENVADFQKALAYNSFGTPEIREQLVSVSNSIVASNAQVTGSDSLIALAIDQMKAQTVATPNDARYQMLTGLLFNSIGRYSDAIPFFQKAQSLSPQKQTILFELGASYIGNKQYPQAEAVYKQAYELDTTYQDAELYYAISALYNNDAGTANKLLASMPQDVVIHNDQLLYAYYQLGMYDKVLSLWKARVAENPQDPQQHVSLAAAYLLVKDRKDAIAEIQKAIQIYPDFKQQGEAYIQQIQQGKI